MFGQSFEAQHIPIVGLLILLEGVLSVDNALVLGMLARRLPRFQQGRALTYGLVGAFVFRLIAIATVEQLMRWHIVKLLGGAYLIYISAKYFFFESHAQQDEQIVESTDGLPGIVDAATGQPLTAEAEQAELEARTIVPVPEATETLSTEAPTRKYPNFWLTVGSIELTDIAFAVDSILAAMAFLKPVPTGHVGPHPELWVVFTGGFLGVVLMRFAAVMFIKLLERFPRFEVSAYLLVIIIGCKLLIEFLANTPEYAKAHPEHPHAIDFHSLSSPAFWIFWTLMVAAFTSGFLPKKAAATPDPRTSGQPDKPAS
jgi:YkoY family integral membrane protein